MHLTTFALPIIKLTTMRKTIISRFFYLSFFLILTSFGNSAGTDISKERLVKSNINTAEVAAEKSAELYSAMLYEKMNLAKAGLDKEVLDAALEGHQKLVDKGAVRNSQYLTIVDFSQSSRKRRFYLLDLNNIELVMNTFVSHGKNSGVDRAEKFSNVPESEKSSLGFYTTKNPYIGKHGLSLRLAGLEKGFNDNAERRAIVLHGAKYVNAGRVKSTYMGRSQGCPAVPQAQSSKIIKLIKNGTALFIYHPSEKYLNNSELLNS
jgi:hypothetical protein